MTTPKKQGGLGFFDLKEFCTCLRVNIIKRYRPAADDLWMNVLDRELHWNKDDRTKILKLGNAALQNLAANTCVGCIDLSLNSLSHCAKNFPSEPESCDNSWFMQPLFQNENVKFPKLGKKTSRYKMEIFKPEDCGLYGHNITNISECF